MQRRWAERESGEKMLRHAVVPEQEHRPRPTHQPHLYHLCASEQVSYGAGHILRRYSQAKLPLEILDKPPMIQCLLLVKANTLIYLSLERILELKLKPLLECGAVCVDELRREWRRHWQCRIRGIHLPGRG
jgi:hypothetical protein